MLALPLALALTTNALADEPLPRWTFDAPRRFITEMKVETPYVMYLAEDRNGVAMVSFLALGAVVECRPETVLPKDKGWEVACAVQDASFFAMPVVGDEGRAEAAVRDYEAALEGASVHLRLSPEGHVSKVRLDQPKARTARALYILDMEERYLELALAPLDAWLPEEGTVVGTPYKQKSFYAAEMPVKETAMGSLKATQTYKGRDGEEAVLEGSASGAIQVGADSWNVQYASVTRFRDGGVAHGELELKTTANSSGIGARQVPYSLWSRVRALGPDDEVTLSPSQEF